jgi:hypothetical protein
MVGWGRVLFLSQSTKNKLDAAPKDVGSTALPIRLNIAKCRNEIPSWAVWVCTMISLAGASGT